MRHMYRARIILIGVTLATFACQRDSAANEADTSAPLMSFDTARVRIVTKADTQRIVAELARTSPEQTMGLMGRSHLSDSAGMLFLYNADQPATAAFWMFRTKIPLDI